MIKKRVSLKSATENVFLYNLCHMSNVKNILKSKHIQNPAEYLRWRILLRILYKYSRSRGPIYSKLPHIQNQCVSATP